MGPKQKRLDATAVAVPVPEERTFESDLVAVLDTDECLFHSKFISEKAARYANHFPIQSGTVDETGDGESDTDGDELENVVDSFELLLPD